MCGFVALYNLDESPVEQDLVVRMTDEQRHRGPDDQGYALFSMKGRGSAAPWQPVKEAHAAAGPKHSRSSEGAFGFNRLSIRDLSPAGHQPMLTPDGRVVMVFNGEIYNADEERPELARRGITFRGTSDTEVLLHMYRTYGVEETLRRLNGMFAFVIADLDQRRIVMARDHLGIKPLYFFHTPKAFAAASEAKSLLLHPQLTRMLDEENLAEHLVFRSCVANRHLLRGVQQVQPGEWLDLRVGDSSGTLRPHRYWRPHTRQTWRGSFRDGVDAVEAAIERSVRLQLVSDVPVGCQFSAGVDSSLVSALANRHQTKGRYHTFSIVVKDDRYNEEEWIAHGERLLDVPGHRFPFGAAEFADRLERATWHLDAPLDHMNSIGIMLLAERSREHVTVLLSGEGADETFCGYARFQRVLLRSPLGKIAPLLARVPRLGEKLRPFGAERGADDRDWFIRSSAPLLPEHVASLLGGKDVFEAAMEMRRAMFPTEADGGDLIARCRAYELETFLVGLLKRQDKMTMAHSMENRVPLLDYELVDLVSSMPSSFCVDLALRPRRERNTKRLLKAVTERHFPKRYVYRKKQGFGLPLIRYFQAPEMQPLIESVIRSATQRGLVNARIMRRWWKDEIGRPNIAEALWIAITFELWARQIFDGDSHRTTRVAA